MASYLNGLLNIVNVLCISVSSVITTKSPLHCVFEQQIIQDLVAVVEGMRFLA